MTQRQVIVTILLGVMIGLLLFLVALYVLPADSISQLNVD